jgi:hypothetical protein
MSGSQSNIRLRPNVVSFQRFLSDLRGFERALSWEELHQYLSLFWVNRASEVLANLTTAQLAEREQFQDLGHRLPDAYLSACNAHRFLLLPNMDGKDGAAHTSPVTEKPVEQPEVSVAAVAVGMSQQDRVVLAPLSAKQLVIAPPGTGKTHAVVQRLAHLAAPGQFCGDLTPVLMVSFSRAAAAELTQRLALEMTRRSGAIYQLPRISTLDSFSGVLLAELLQERNEGGYDASIRSLARILEGAEGKPLQQRAAALIRQRIRLVVVDEVQDVVGVRARLVRDVIAALEGAEHGVLLLGDLRQAIYGFALRDAPHDEQSLDPFWLIREVRRMYSDLEEIGFTEQYRFSPSCQGLMTRLQAAMDDPLGRSLPGERPDRALLREVLGEIPGLDDPLQLAGEDARRNRVAILARSNQEVARLEVACRDVLARFGRTVRAVRRSEGGGYPGWVGRVLGAPTAPPRYTAEGFLRAYAEQVGGDRHEAGERLGWLLTACRLQREAFNRDEVIKSIRDNPDVPSDLREQPRPGEVWVSTIHQAKGREFDAVVVADVDRLLSSGDDPEDCRLAYVAVTRARREVSRCAGGYWLPPVFDWALEHFDTAQLNASAMADMSGWHRAQEDLWRAYRGTGRMVLRYRGGGHFVLEPEAFGGVVLALSEAFTTAFLHHAAHTLRVNAPLDAHYSVRITDLRTYTTASDRTPVILLPELSGQIERIG